MLRRRVPGVDLENTDLYEADEPRQIVDDEVLADLLLLPDADAAQRRGRPRSDVLLVEALLRQTLGTPDQRGRPPAEMGQDPVRDRLVEPRQCDLRDPLRRAEHPLAA